MSIGLIYYWSIKMSQLKLAFLSVLFLLNIQVLYSQDVAKVKDSFKQVIEKELKSLQEWSKSDKANPERTILNIDFIDGFLFKAFYKEYKSYRYDIQKTNSIVTPFIGIVTFRELRYEKAGKSKSECLNSEWKLVGK